MLGKWNRSVILTYLGLACAVAGIFLAVAGYKVSYAFICLMLAGIFDLFDGPVARKVKRNEEEKKFGVEIDSVVDAVSFIALPIAIFTASGLNAIPFVILYIVYAISGAARLAYFNAVDADTEGPVRYYTGLPVTYSALIFPLFYLLSLILDPNIFTVIYAIVIAAVAVLQVVKVKIVKPKGIAYVIFGVLAIVLITVFIIFL
ncbi:MAG: CDP-alcohol phosphatidyltransferase family protein [Clostridiales bacterium]|nr:CDP-alcohol phosphatidyltransferase family protein [Clostridiales bacterium]